MWQALLEKDRELFLWLNGSGSPAWDAFWLALSDKWLAIPLYLLLAWAAWRQFGWKGTAVLLVAVALLITCTDQLANFFKYGVARLRPCHDPALEGLVRLVKASCGGSFGYFSAHAANSFALATFFSMLWGPGYRAAKGMLLLWALFVAVSRIYLGVHYPLDVATGILFGGLFGWMFARLFLLARQKWSL